MEQTPGGQRNEPDGYFNIELPTEGINIGIKHGFLCINVCQVPRKMLKTEAVGRDFQDLPKDRTNVNLLENHV